MYSDEFPDYSLPEAPPEYSTPTEPPLKESNYERFLNLTGNWGEFGLYFGLALTGGLLVRAIPVLIPAAIILVPCVGTGLVIYSLSSETSNKLRPILILLSVMTSIVAANWDGWLAWVTANYGLLLGLGVGVLVILAIAVYLVGKVIRNE